MKPNRNGPYCPHCPHFVRGFSQYSCRAQLNDRFNWHWEPSLQDNCPIYHAETHEEALEALMLLRLTNAPK